jgi:hypothetical protein
MSSEHYTLKTCRTKETAHMCTLNLAKTLLYVYNSVPHDRVMLTVRFLELCYLKEIIQNYISETEAVTTFLLICSMRNDRKYHKQSDKRFVHGGSLYHLAD